jgi:hypothetical protein
MSLRPLGRVGAAPLAEPHGAIAGQSIAEMTDAFGEVDERTDRDLVSASELAQLGYCERVAHFDWRYGARRSPEQLVAQDRGNAAHDQFYKDSLAIARASERKGRCFVATLALGECAETRALRAFRDLYLRRTAQAGGSSRRTTASGPRCVTC